MAQLNNQNYYSYCLRNWQDSAKAVLDLVNSKSAVLGKSIGIVDRLYKYIEPIGASIARLNNNPLADSYQSLIKFLDPYLANAFIKDPGDKITRDNLTEEVVLIYAAMGNTIPVAPYSPDEMKKIVAGELSYYDDFVFSSTVSRVLEGKEEPGYANTLMNILHPEGARLPDLSENTTWVISFLTALMLHAAWRNFASLDSNKQETLIKNHFYQGIISGVPVEKALMNFVNNSISGKSEEKVELLANWLVDNQEMMLVDSSANASKSLSEVIKIYFAQLGGGRSTGFAQEEYLKTFYEGQSHREIFRSWLREVLVIITHLNE